MNGYCSLGEKLIYLKQYLIYVPTHRLISICGPLYVTIEFLYV